MLRRTINKNYVLQFVTIKYNLLINYAKNNSSEEAKNKALITTHNIL